MKNRTIKNPPLTGLRNERSVWKKHLLDFHAAVNRGDWPAADQHWIDACAAASKTDREWAEAACTAITVMAGKLTDLPAIRRLLEKSGMAENFRPLHLAILVVTGDLRIDRVAGDILPAVQHVADWLRSLHLQAEVST